jgi:hypothetical protein
MITSIKILRDRVVKNQKTAGEVARHRQRWQRWELDSSSGSGSLATARRQGPQDDNTNQKYSEIGYHGIKRLWGQQRDGSGNGGGGKMAEAAAAAAWQQRGIRGRTTITSIKITQG